MTRIMTFREDSTCNVSNDPSSQGICPKKCNWCCLECLNLNIATHLSYKERKSDLKMWITSWLTAFAGSNFYVRCDGPWHIFKQLFGQPRRYTFVENNTNKLNWYNSDTDKYPTDPLNLVQYYWINDKSTKVFKLNQNQNVRCNVMITFNDFYWLSSWYRLHPWFRFKLNANFK